MTSVLIELIGTLYVGGLAIALAVAGLWAIQATRAPFGRWLKELGNWPTPSSFAVPLALGCFGIGVFTEGITDWMTDSEAYRGSTILDLQVDALGIEGELRASALFAEDHNGVMRLRALGDALFRHADFVAGTTGDSEFAHSPISFMAGGVERHMMAIRYVNQLYYTAKNWCYSQDNYFQELERLQRRIDWSRSSFLILSWGGLIVAAWMVLVVVALGLLRLTRILERPLRYLGLRAVRMRHLENMTRNYLWKTIGRLTTVGFVAVPASWMCVETYRQSEEQFNERAFGYFVSARLGELSSSRPLDAPSPRSEGMEAGQAMMLGGLLWMQTSAEYEALCLTIFSAAEAAMRTGLNREGRPCAVIMDLDETVLDNTAYNADLVLTGAKYDADSWSEWVSGRADEVRLVPGAKRFIDAMRWLGVRVFFVSNRTQDQLRPTLAAMIRLELGSEAELQETVRLRDGNEVGKQSRRDAIAREYEVIGLLGDSLADFAAVFDDEAGLSVDARWQQVRGDGRKRPWGSRWFVLPNPVYGDWTRPLDWSRPWIYSFTANPRR